MAKKKTEEKTSKSPTKKATGKSPTKKGNAKTSKTGKKTPVKKSGTKGPVKAKTSKNEPKKVKTDKAKIDKAKTNPEEKTGGNKTNMFVSPCGLPFDPNPNSSCNKQCIKDYPEDHAACLENFKTTEFVKTSGKPKGVSGIGEKVLALFKKGTILSSHNIMEDLKADTICPIETFLENSVKRGRLINKNMFYALPGTDMEHIVPADTPENILAYTHKTRING